MNNNYNPQNNKLKKASTRMSKIEEIVAAATGWKVLLDKKPNDRMASELRRDLNTYNTVLREPLSQQYERDYAYVLKNRYKAS